MAWRTLLEFGASYLEQAAQGLRSACEQVVEARAFAGTYLACCFPHPRFHSMAGQEEALGGESLKLRRGEYLAAGRGAIDAVQGAEYSTDGHWIWQEEILQGQIVGKRCRRHRSHSHPHRAETATKRKCAKQREQVSIYHALSRMWRRRIRTDCLGLSSGCIPSYTRRNVHVISEKRRRSNALS